MTTRINGDYLGTYGSFGCAKMTDMEQMLEHLIEVLTNITSGEEKLWNCQGIRIGRFDYNGKIINNKTKEFNDLKSFISVLKKNNIKIPITA
jgi:hypothetical protein